MQKNIQLDAFVLMPFLIHGILIIDGNENDIHYAVDESPAAMPNQQSNEPN